MRAPIADPGDRRIVNTNRGVTNVVPMSEEKEHLQNLLKRFKKTLLGHCGPTSDYAMIVNTAGAGLNFEPNVFTRDGIDILSAVECMSPIETYVKDLICYLGSRVDSAAKDGTTTSMLIAIYFLEYLLTSPYFNFSTLKMLTSFQKKDAATRIFNSILDQLREESVITVDQLCGEDTTEENYMRWAGIVAFCQAMSSSGGDIELAAAMMDIYRKSPRISWDFIDFYQSSKESGDRFTVEVDEFDTQVKCVSATAGGLNAGLGTEYYAENVKCIILTDSFVDFDQKLDNLIEGLRTLTYTTDNPIVIVIPHVPPKLASAVMQCNEENRGTSTNKISIWQYSAEHKLAGQALNWELMIPVAIAGATPYNHPEITPETPLSEEHIFTAKEVRWQNNYLRFYGVIEQVDSVLHPYYQNPETATPYYTEVLTGLQTYREMIEDNRIHDSGLATIFVEMLNRITCPHRPHLRLGGPAHEQIASFPIVKDVLGAIMSSLRHGFTVKGPVAVLHAVHALLKESKVQGLAAHYSLFVAMGINQAYTILLSDMYGQDTCAEQLIGADKQVLTGQLAKCNMNQIFIDSNARMQDWWLDGKTAYRNSLHREAQDFVQFCQGIITGEAFTPEKIAHTLIAYPVMQPVKITEELFKRLQELFLKFANVNEIIAQGGVLVKEKDSRGYNNDRPNTAE